MMKEAVVGTGIAVTAGVVGLGVLVAKASKKKKEEETVDADKTVSVEDFNKYRKAKGKAVVETEKKEKKNWFKRKDKEIMEEEVVETTVVK